VSAADGLDQVVPVADAGRRRARVAVGPRTSRIVFRLPFAAGLVGMAVGGASLFENRAEALAVPALLLLALATMAAQVVDARRTGEPDRRALALALGFLAGAALMLLLPRWLYGFEVNGIIHRSVVAAPLVLGLSVLGTGWSIRGLQGHTPSSADAALYPVLALPIGLTLVAYGLILGGIVVAGLGGFRLDLLTTAWKETLAQVNNVPTFVYDVGLRNNILGTLELIVLSALFAILPGVGAGVFMSEYPGSMANIVGFATTMLRAVSVFIIGAAALGVVAAAAGLVPGTLLSDLIRGVSYDENGLPHAGTGSFVVASAFLSILIIPMLAKLTEEGLRSVPRDIREGSVALGATEGFGLRRILLPWATLNILTGLLLGAAEATGGLAVIMFIAGTGQDGISPTSSVTSLDYAVFAATYGFKPYVDTMHPYQSTAALLLLVLTLGLTAAAQLLRRRIARRYRGALTSG